jgi:hypothetical protein
MYPGLARLARAFQYLGSAAVTYDNLRIGP